MFGNFSPKPPARLIHTFTLPRMEGVKTTCIWELEEVDGGTILTLTHEGLEKLGANAASSASDLDKGWDEHFARLRRVAA